MWGNGGRFDLISFLSVCVADWLVPSRSCERARVAVAGHNCHNCREPFSLETGAVANLRVHGFC